ncbi:MAG TPA: hypothetical protein VKU19_39750 [Bryobacteraceae bacterium]|nr:hypothetical protein [Bryobacteraceae bacterium]
MSIFGSIPGGGACEFISMVASVLAGTATGLFFSAIARTGDQASMLVPIALIPQILLAGAIVPDLLAVPDFLAHVAISGFWVFRSMKSGLQNNMGDAHFALLILAIHTSAFLVVPGIMMCDARDQMVYGKAINRLLKFWRGVAQTLLFAASRLISTLFGVSTNLRRLARPSSRRFLAVLESGRGAQKRPEESGRGREESLRHMH